MTLGSAISRLPGGLYCHAIAESVCPLAMPCRSLPSSGRQLDEVLLFLGWPPQAQMQQESLAAQVAQMRAAARTLPTGSAAAGSGC